VTAADSTSVTRNPQHPDPVSVHYSLHNDHAQNRNFWIQAQALPRSQLAAESACSTANYQSPCVTGAPAKAG